MEKVDIHGTYPERYLLLWRFNMVDEQYCTYCGRVATTREMGPGKLAGFLRSNGRKLTIVILCIQCMYGCVANSLNPPDFLFAYNRMWPQEGCHTIYSVRISYRRNGNAITFPVLFHLFGAACLLTQWPQWLNHLQTQRRRQRNVWINDFSTKIYWNYFCHEFVERLLKELGNLQLDVRWMLSTRILKFHDYCYCSM